MFLRLLALSIACFIVLLSKGENQNNRKKDHRGPDKRQKKPSPSHRYKNFDHPSEEEHRTAEQFNWRNGFYLGLWTLVAAITAAGFAFGGWRESRRQANAAQAQLDISESEHRAWIKVTITKASGLSGNTMSTIFQAENVGHSIAFNVQGFIDASVNVPAGESVYTAQRKECATLRNVMINPVAVFPGMSVNVLNGLNGQYKITLSQDGIDRILPHQYKAPQIFGLSIYGCIDYKLTVDGNHHQTFFSFPVGIGANMTFSKGIEVEPEQLVFYSNLGSSDAN